MTSRIRLGACVAAAALAFGFAARAEAPRTYAIKGARIVTVSGAPIQSGTIVLRNGLIDAVGADAQAPSDAVVVDGAGMTVYPGLIDMGSTAGTDIQINLAQTQQGSRTPTMPSGRSDDDPARTCSPPSLRLDARSWRARGRGRDQGLATAGDPLQGQSALGTDEPEFEPTGSLAQPRAGLASSARGCNAMRWPASAAKGFRRRSRRHRVRPPELQRPHTHAVSSVQKTPDGLSRPSLDRR